MCIRDSVAAAGEIEQMLTSVFAREIAGVLRKAPGELGGGCLLSTSEAADERASVDLGGGRIIKKKKKINAHSVV